MRKRNSKKLRLSREELTVIATHHSPVVSHYLKEGFKLTSGTHVRKKANGTYTMRVVLRATDSLNTCALNFVITPPEATQ